MARMHELAVCRALIEELKRVARIERAVRIASVLVRIGPLSGVEPALLESAYEVARVGTLAADAELKLEITPVRILCRRCNTRAKADGNRLACPRCGDWRTQVLSGDELLLASVELERAADAGTPGAAAAAKGSDREAVGHV